MVGVVKAQRVFHDQHSMFTLSDKELGYEHDDDIDESRNGGGRNNTKVDTAPSSKSRRSSMHDHDFHCDASNAANLSLFADSPYYDSLIDKEMATLDIASTLFQKLAAKTKRFSDEGSRMAMATRQLAMVCKLHLNDNVTDDHQSSNNNNPNNDNAKNDEGQKEETEADKVRNALGVKMCSVLEKFGETLDDIANAQEIMCKQIELVLGSSHIVENAAGEVNIAKKLKQEAIDQTEKEEELLAKYLNDEASALKRQQLLNEEKEAAEAANKNDCEDNTKNNKVPKNGIEDMRLSIIRRKNPRNLRRRGSFLNGNDNADASSAAVDPPAHGVVTAATPTRRIPIASKSTSRGLRRTASLGIPSRTHSVGHISIHPRIIAFMDCKKTIETLCKSQMNGTLKRFQLMKHFVDAKHYRNHELSKSTGKVLLELQSYFVHCTGSVQSIVRYANDYEKKCSNLYTSHSTVDKSGWRKRGNLILTAFSQIEKKAVVAPPNDSLPPVRQLPTRRGLFRRGGTNIDDDSSNKDNDDNKEDELEANNHPLHEMSREATITKQKQRQQQQQQQPTLLGPDGTVNITLDDMEKEVWDIPQKLATITEWDRVIPEGVIVEGWLYERKISQRFMASTKEYSWHRKWFILKGGSLYYFQLNSEASSSPSSSALATSKERIISKVKICDVVLCTVRELHNTSNDSDSNNTTRFCFELVIPNQKQFLTLRARGPSEYKTWVNNIRNAIATELGKVSHDMNDDNYCKNRSFNTDIGQKFKRMSSEIDLTVIHRSSSLIFQDEFDFDYCNYNNNESHPELIGDSSHSSSSSSSYGNGMTTMNDRIKSPVGTHNRNNVILRRVHRRGSTGGLVINNSDCRSNRLVMKLMDCNPTCVDCGLESPDWVSLNLGVLMCINCSGVHRSLGVHVSKVRSLQLDSLTINEMKLILALGNRSMNQIWEKEVDDDMFDSDESAVPIRKPTPMSDKAAKEEWIKSKYVRKRFLGNAPGNIELSSSSSINQYLYDAVCQGHVFRVADALARGGCVNWKNEHGKTPLEACLHVLKQQQQCRDADEGGDSNGKYKRRKKYFEECIELLWQNGAEVSDLSEDDKLMLEKVNLKISASATTTGSK